tara:strand:+ start:823 stop:1224 length:402 start_codon:yes stop_codon:yes gene_type:complete
MKYLNLLKKNINLFLLIIILVLIIIIFRRIIVEGATAQQVFDRRLGWDSPHRTGKEKKQGISKGFVSPLDLKSPPLASSNQKKLKETSSAENNVKTDKNAGVQSRNTDGGKMAYGRGYQAKVHENKKKKKKGD